MQKLFVAFIAVVAVSLLGFVGLVSAAEYRASDNITISTDEVISDDVYASGTTIQVDGVIEGDLYAAGQTIIINGEIDGDLIAAGSTITISGSINGSVRVAGQSLNLTSGQVSGGVTFFGKSLNTDAASSIGRGVLFAGERATLNGEVTHGITAYGSSVAINSFIGTSSSITAQEVAIDDDAIIAGNIDYRSDEEASISDQAQIQGEVSRTGDFKRAEIDLQAMRTSYTLWSFAAALLTGGVLLLIARRATENTATLIQKRPLPIFGWGLLALLLSFPLILLLMASIIGIPLALLVITGLIVALYLSKIFVGIALGRIILQKLSEQKNPNVFLSLLIGLAVVYAVNLVPVVTVFASILIGTTGVGAIIISAGKALSRPPAKTKSK